MRYSIIKESIMKQNKNHLNLTLARLRNIKEKKIKC
jgi:hypothetical protein